MQETVKSQKKPIKRGRKILVIALCVLLVLVLAAGGAAALLLRRGLPQVAGTLKIPGFQANVAVTRDEEGVPHIAAQNKHDLYMAQGYVQAQDRLFQMDLSRRQASGRLSEVLGERAVETDKKFRTLGLRRAAEISWPTYSQEGIDIITAFCDGVNAYITEHNNDLSIEFMLLGYKPEPWTPIDCLTIGKYMSYDLAGHWESQAFRQYLLDTFTQEEAAELFPENTYPTGAPLIIPAGTARVADRFLSADTAFLDEWNGSNNWVVAGSKTASGQPLLSNDPHLSIASPSVWYQMHLQAEDINVSGVIFGGAPGIIVGHNEHVAWGVTNTGPDVQDLYIEKLNPDNPHQYEYKGEWLDATVVQEDIHIKGGKVEPFEVVVTQHGPIISEMADTGKDNYVYALQWTALEPSTEIEGMLEMDAATDWASFEKALEKFHSPTQNFVFAGDDGTIAYKANGKIPIRSKGDGLLPVPGWTGEYEWTGYIPFDELPRVVNPASGFIATANHKVIGDEYPYHISHMWAQPYRQQRIVEVLHANDQLTSADMQALQADVLDLHAAEMVPIFAKALAQSELTDRQRTALDILAQWDYQSTEEQAGPLVFGLWFNQISTVIFEDRIAEEMAPLFEGRNYTVDALIRKEGANNPSLWIANKGGFEKVLLTALDRALDGIEAAQGKDATKWTWGKFHQVGFEHPLSGQWPLQWIYNAEGRKPSPGTNTTVRAASWTNSGLNQHGASWRFVRDFAQPGYAYHMVAPGESGHPLSPYYHKQFDRWIFGEHYKTYIEGFTGKTLTLSPAE